MLLDEFMPVWDFDERHQARAVATPQQAFEAAWTLDMRASPLTCALLRMRELPYRLFKKDWDSKGFGYTLEDMVKLGFLRLAHDPPREFVLGLVGRFWNTDFGIVQLDPQEFRGFSQDGYAKVASNFYFQPTPGGQTIISTETRVQCLGLAAKAGFRGYWTLIRPFSGFIRHEWLRVVRKEAERISGRGR